MIAHLSVLVRWLLDGQQKGVPAIAETPQNTSIFGCGGAKPAVLAAVERSGVKPPPLR
jgi:hypothetical protein